MPLLLQPPEHRQPSVSPGGAPGPKQATSPSSRLECPSRQDARVRHLHAAARRGSTKHGDSANRSVPDNAAAAPALDLKTLEQRLRDTHAIGVFTKLSLKNQVDDLLAQFKTFYGGHSQITLVQLRQKYEVLLLKVVSVLQNDDPQLASAISSSREAIWSVLADPKSFANI